MTPPVAGRTLDEVALALSSGQPDSFYELAAALDAVGDELDELARRLGGQMDAIDEAWKRGVGSDPSTGSRASQLYALLREIRPGDFGPVLHQVGDRLAAAKAQVSDLQLQRDQAGATADPSTYDHQANLVLHDVSEAFVELGADLPSLPEHTALGNPVDSSNLPPPPSVLIPAEVVATSATVVLADASVFADGVVDGPVGRTERTELAAVAPFHAVLPGDGDAPSIPDLRAAAAAAAAADHPSSSGAGGGPMPMMPMGGMGMGGAGGPQQQRERRTAGMASPGPDTWEEAAGWGVLGRKPGADPTPPAPAEIVLPDGTVLRTGH